jgi:HAD superfamily hydrolase (TIGR01459 family)
MDSITSRATLRDVFGPNAAPHRSYRAVLLDQFGVLHDGQNAYHGAAEAVEYLHKECGLRILIVSNSSRRSSGALNNLAKKGINVEFIEDVITSGEVTWSCLSSEPREGRFEGLQKCVHFTWGARGAISLEGLDVSPVGEDGSLADFILAHGTEAIGCPSGEPSPCSLTDMKAIMDDVVGRGIPMLVANPDIVTVDGEELRVMPGTLARYYEQLGGVAHRMGKPDRIIYEEAMRMLDLRPQELVAIGDSMEHDIAGAAAMGIDSVFIAGGIHKDIAMKDGVIDEEGIEHLCRDHGVSPTYVLSMFTR